MSRGIYDQKPEQTLVLLLDFKSDGRLLWPLVHDHLKSLKELDLLSSVSGSNMTTRPLTVVATGNVPVDVIADCRVRCDIFYNAPLTGRWDATVHLDGTDGISSVMSK
jgi:hypothetical protein